MFKKVAKQERMINSVKLRSEYKQLLALFLGIFTVLLYFFGDVLLAPNDYLLQKEGDGLKNYHTLVWYLDHDKGSHFSGMNYPYGEHILYTDNQPALAVTLKFIHEYITPISHYTVGIVNSLLFFSIFICGLLLYLILRKFSVEPWFAMVFALFICFMSPQLRRMSGHYSLAYCVFIPLLWYQMICFMENRQVFKRGLGIILLICLFSFIHLYYLLIATLMVMAYTFVWALRRRKRLPKKRLIYLLAIGILPLIIVASILGITDTIVDRPAAPGGFFHYRAFFKSIFIPVTGAFYEFLDKNIMSPSHRFESQAYVGIIAFLVVIFSVIKMIRKGIARKFKQFPTPILSARMNDWIWAGTLVLLFSMAFPFTLGLKFLLDYLPGLQQFRSLGRFAWVFYYIIGVYAAYYCYLGYRYLRMTGREGIAIVVLVGVLTIWALEANFTMRAVDEAPLAKNVYFANKSNDLNTKLKAEGYVIDEFQALLVLPYYLIGSEKTYIQRYWKSFVTSVKFSQQVGLPLAQGNLSRTSISQTLHLAQQVSGPLIKKEILADLPNTKPYLVLAYDKELLADEKILLKKATVIGKLNNLTIYELPLSAFNNNFKSIWKTYERGNLSEYNGILTDKASTSVYVDELETPKSGLFFQGKERKKTQSEQLQLMEGKLDVPQGKDFVASVWIYADPKFPSYPKLKLEQYDAEGKLVSTLEKDPTENTESTKGWLRVAVNFEYKSEETLKFFLEGKGIAAASFQIRPKNIKVYQEIEKDKVLNYNNYFIEK